MRKRPLASPSLSMVRLILVFECLAGTWSRRPLLSSSSFTVAEAFTSTQQQQQVVSVLGQREGIEAPNAPMILFGSHSQRKLGTATRLASSKQSRHSDDRQTSATTSADRRRGRSRSTVLWVAVGSLLTTTVAAELGLLGGDYATHPASLGQDVGAAVLTGILGYAFVKINTYAVEHWGLDPKDARKIIHTLSAPLFMLFWPIFTPNDSARFFAACVPLTNAVRLYLASTTSATAEDDGSIDNSDEAALARAVSRSGNSKEALGGPFVYVLIMSAAILGWWRSSPVGVVALATMAAGDGVADLLGRRFGKNNQWPGLKKSVAGTVGFILAATATSLGLLLWLNQWGCFTLGFSGLDLLERVALISTVSSLLELLPVGDDNYTVPLSAALMSILLLS